MENKLSELNGMEVNKLNIWSL